MKKVIALLSVVSLVLLTSCGVKDAAENAVETATDAGAAVVDTVDNATDAVVETTTDAVEATGEVVEGAADAVVDTATDAVDTAEEMIDDAADTVEAVVEGSEEETTEAEEETK